VTAWAIGLALLPALAPQAAQQKPKDKDTRWAVFAERLYDPEDGVIENALVTVANGKIVSVTPGAKPGKDGLQAFAMTPGLIDASVRIADQRTVEQSSEVTPGLDVLDSLDGFDIEWERQLESGVTTVLVTPLDQNVIGGLGAVVKTGGSPSLRGRALREAAVLRGSMGTQPSQRNHPAFGRPTDVFSRRPTTRMGVEWEWRKALYDAAVAGGDASRAFPGSEELQAVLRGEIPLSIQAWATQDIRTAVFLVEECQREGLGSPRLIVDAAAEAWREPELLVRSKAWVVLPPFPADGRTYDNAFMSMDVAKVLHDKNIPFALSSHGAAAPEQRLAMQAGYAMRGGLAFQDALAAVTIVPARMLGVDDRVGSLDVGKDADLVLWSGEPFQPASRVVGVLLDGVLVVDPRPAD
jgi:imidazolonepropionase-like amidohydrolase